MNTKIEINDCVYNIHPIYDLYGADKNGYIINIINKIPIKGNCNNRGYMSCNVRKHAQNGQKAMLVHRFVWECFNGLIPCDKVIDHINDNAEDNRLCNLKLVTHQENCKKVQKMVIIHLLNITMITKDVSKLLTKILKKYHIIKACIKHINVSISMLV